MEPRPCPPPAGGPLPWAGGRQGTGPEAGGGAVGPRPAEGRAARLVLQRLLLEEAVETEGLLAEAGACRAPGGRSTARLGGPEGGSRGQVIPSWSFGACAHTRTEAAEPGHDGGAGRGAEVTPAALRSHRLQLGWLPAWGTG